MKTVIAVDPGSKDGTVFATSQLAIDRYSVPLKNGWADTSKISRMAREMGQAFYHGRPVAKFVDTAIKAARNTDPGYISPEFIVTDWLRADPDLLQLWIFGPRGEFTGYARLAEMEDLGHRCFRAGSRPDAVLRWTSKVVADVSFDVQVYPYDHSRFLYSDPSQPTLILSYIRFSSYRDYALWEEAASHDESHHLLSGRPR